MSKLSQTVKDICKDHFSAECAGCPIMVACETPVVPLTQRTLDAYRDNVNRAALAVVR